MLDHEKFPSDSASKKELPPMLPEDIADMRSQIPILREMLKERKLVLSQLENDPSANQAHINKLKTEVEELEIEIAGRED